MTKFLRSLIWVAVAMLGALALGMAVTVAQELSDRSLRSETEAGTALTLPVLACVPELNGAGVVTMLPLRQQAEA